MRIWYHYSFFSAGIPLKRLYQKSPSLLKSNHFSLKGNENCTEKEIFFFGYLNRLLLQMNLQFIPRAQFSKRVSTENTAMRVMTTEAKNNHIKNLLSTLAARTQSSCSSSVFSCSFTLSARILTAWDSAAVEEEAVTRSVELLSDRSP